ncbi:hypothetical protein OsJ_00172 [Oryza sativa Japonica Group]|uniref:Uncharacterized protein n=1 Tax=Oryza sativa subsp. japonica TaxID=39947 RepID=A2ZNN9_ORYSJ|nr:hypothetical protein OsJ_00172 [Oryza sativa Japonica Group]
MAALSSASLLPPPSTFVPVLSPLRKPPPQHLAIRGSPHRRRGRRLSLAASSAASPDLEKEPSQSPSPSPQEKSPGDLSAVAESVKVLKEAAKTRKVPSPELLAALAKIKKAKLDTSTFFETLGGTQSPGRTWMLIFTAKGRLEKGQYFPVTAVQRFDAAMVVGLLGWSGAVEQQKPNSTLVVHFLGVALLTPLPKMEDLNRLAQFRFQGKRIENGVYLGPVGSLTFEGRLSWKKKILAFIFERVRIKVGPFGPLEISLGGGNDGREPSTKDPFFVWFYVDEEIAVAQGRGGGVAYWCRCKRVP